ncbi:hypothetical protein ALQ20_101699 [Pseudomonas syringae pv. atrofaciens]|nr:hypothetical protein ALQ96_101106 [Pseudomonas syringae pv. atrofaciens]RMP66226.1 hypothetical protein ALQ20_101699 [Pseudomonas syringae pv. atrofaciens]
MTEIIKGAQETLQMFRDDFQGRIAEKNAGVDTLFRMSMPLRNEFGGMSRAHKYRA